MTKKKIRDIFNRIVFYAFYKFENGDAMMIADKSNVRCKKK